MGTNKVTTPILTTALDLAAAGLSIIPIRPDGTKAPATSWKPYTLTPATPDQIHAWWTTNPDYDLAVIHGTISGGLEMAEIEGRAADRIHELRDLAHDSGLGTLWDTIVTGWLEQSPSGGIHLHYYITDTPVPGNTKIARNSTGEIVAETRGEGGYSVVAPSTHHPTGNKWTRLIGGPTTAARLTMAQRDDLHTLLATLDEQPDSNKTWNKTRNKTTPDLAPHDPTAGITPGDDYENRTDWADILTPHGWTLITTRGRTRYWRRPGKTEGISATTGHADDRDRLYVFSSSTDFQQEVPYTKLGAVAVLEHGGNMSAAAKTLAQHGYGTPTEQPRDLTQYATTTPTGSPATPATITEPATYTLTDDGNALRYIDTHHPHIRYCPQTGMWLTWNGHRWQWDQQGHTAELARDLARNLPTTTDPERKHRTRSLSRNAINNTLSLAKTDPRTIANLSDLDARPYELNTPGGVIDLRTGTLTTPDPTALHTRTTTITPDPNHPTPRWHNFIADTFAGDPDLTAYIQRLLGVSLVGTVLEQILPFAYGAGANGKSVLFETIQEIVGLAPDGYATTIPADMLTTTRNNDHPATIAQLSGVRLAIGGELEQGTRFAEAKVKMLTGGDPINARFMGKNPFTFIPTHSLWLHANHQPEVKTGGPAFWRRLRQLPFTNTVPEEKRIKNLKEQLIEHEAPGILAWIIQGAHDYFAHGLTEPAAVTAATDAYQHETDTIGQFVEERCTTGNPNAQHLHVRTSTLREAYETWCRTEGYEPVTARALTQTLRARWGIQASRSSSARFYDGIRLNDIEEVSSEVSLEVSSSVTEVSPGEEWWQQ